MSESGGATVNIDAMRASLTADHATKLVARLTGEPEVSIEQQIYYPFFHFAASARLRWLFGERRMCLDCLVDARTGRAASADALTIERIEAEPKACVAAVKDGQVAEKNARRYASHALGRSFRVLGNFNLELAPAVLVHRPYWVVRAADHSVLVDAVTGDVHPLVSNRQRVA